METRCDILRQCANLVSIAFFMLRKVALNVQNYRYYADNFTFSASVHNLLYVNLHIIYFFKLYLKIILILCILLLSVIVYTVSNKYARGR